MALFTVSGLLTMYASVILFASYFQSPRPNIPETISKKKKLPYLILIQISLALIASLGLFKLKTGNDPQTIYKPTPRLLESEKRIAEISNQSLSRFITVKGISLQDALEREEANKIMGVSSIVPSIKTQRENFELKKRLYDKELKNFSAQTGITPYNLPVEPSFLTPSNLVGTALEKLTRFGIINSGDFVYLITPSQNEVTYNDKNISIIEPRKIINEAFDNYTSETIKLISISHR
jgi:hypothetical protein